MWRSAQYSFMVMSCDAQMVVEILRKVETQLEVRVAYVYASSLLQEHRVLFDVLAT